MLSWPTPSLPHFQVMQRDGKLEKKTMTPRDLCKGVYKDSVAVGSYSWGDVGLPDPDGERLQKHQNFLLNNPDVKYMFLDFPCNQGCLLIGIARIVNTKCCFAHNPSQP